MQKAINRFWDWLFHPGIRWYHYPKGKASWFRYPSPGSIIRKDHVDDYKKPYQYSELNVRYIKPIKNVSHQPSSVYVGDGAGMNVVEKLQSVGLLGKGQNTPQQIEAAKQKFQQTYGVSADKKVYINNFTDTHFPEGTNRESYRQAIEAHIKNEAEQDRALNMTNTNRRFIKQPEALWLESLDMFSHPHFQQTRIDVSYKLDNHALENAKRGYIDVRKGEKTFWKALDNSNDMKNVEKVQKAIGDEVPTDFTLRDTKIEFVEDKDGNVVDLKPKTRAV